ACPVADRAGLYAHCPFAVSAVYRVLRTENATGTLDGIRRLTARGRRRIAVLAPRQTALSSTSVARWMCRPFSACSARERDGYLGRHPPPDSPGAAPDSHACPATDRIGLHVLARWMCRPFTARSARERDGHLGRHPPPHRPGAAPDSRACPATDRAG